MTGLIYGFVVVAWLIVDLPGRAQHIPFGSMAACKRALETLYRPASTQDHVWCYPSGHTLE